MTLDWQLKPNGLIAKGKRTYHIFNTPKGVCLQVEDNGVYETTGTFWGDDCLREARKVAEQLERDTL